MCSHFLAAAAASAILLSAQTPSANPLTSDTRFFYDGVKNYLLRSAEKMPEEHYSFRPTPDVRSFVQLLGHIADAQYLFCSAVRGEKREPAGIEKGAGAKPAMVESLKAAFGYCDAAFDSMTDAKAPEVIKVFGRERTRLGVLQFNNNHNFEHYGNIITYLRMKGLVPPSSEPRR
jgi:uncharacterized damage-inducible protein DinB